MELTDYTLKSNYQKTVKVPLEYAEWAKKLVLLGINGLTEEEVDKLLADDKYLQNNEFASSLLKLGEEKPGTERSFRLADEVYLSVCRAYCFDRIGERDGGEGIKLGLELTTTIEELNKL